jgi:hypothetical protein
MEEGARAGGVVGLGLCAGFIGVRRPEVWQAGMRRRIELDSSLSPDYPREKEIGLTSGPHMLASKDRKEEVKKGGNDLASRLEWRASSVMGRNRFGWRLNIKTDILFVIFQQKKPRAFQPLMV